MNKSIANCNRVDYKITLLLPEYIKLNKYEKDKDTRNYYFDEFME